MDCEMVGVGPKGEESIAARVSIVNQYGKCVYDKCIKPTQRVTDYRTAVSGIRPENLKQGGSAGRRARERPCLALLFLFMIIKYIHLERV